MKQRGKLLRVFLINGSPTSVKQVEIINWTGVALEFYRNQFDSVRKRDELKQQGIYILFGHNEKALSGLSVYIGEAEVLTKRLAQHIQGKEWHRAIIFGSKDDNLTKSHIKYLENKMYKIISSSGMVEVENKNPPAVPKLPESEKESVEEFLDNILLILGTLGYTQIIEQNNESNQSKDGPCFKVNAKNISAKMKIIDSGFLVLKGSQIRGRMKDSFSDSKRKLREELLKLGIVEQAEDDYVFRVDHLFSSSSAASGFILGRASSGKMDWINEKSNQTLGEFERSELEEYLQK